MVGDSRARDDLADVLAARVPAVLAEWSGSRRPTAPALPGGPADPPPEADMAQVLHGLVAHLGQAEDLATPATLEQLRCYARSRRLQGYTVQEVLIELDHLADIVSRHVGRAAAEAGWPTAGFIAAFNTLNTGLRTLCVLGVGLYREIEAEQNTALALRLEEFARRLGHELRQPMQTLSLSANGLRAMDGERGGDLAHYAEVVETSLARAQDWLEDLRTLAASEHARVDEGWVPLAAVVEEVTTQLRGAARNRGVRVRCGDLVAAEFPRLPLQLGLLNLVSNGIKFSDPAKADRWVAVASDWVGGDAEGTGTIRVSDNGLGVSPQDAGQIFQPHFRAHAEHVQSAGLGLAITRQVVRAHGGSITFDSTPGEGSTFLLRLRGMRESAATGS